MLPDPTPTHEEILDAVVRIGRGHLSVSRGALPFVLPVAVSLDTAGGTGAVALVIGSDHASVVTSAGRQEIAALQVDAVLGARAWSLLVTGPLHLPAPLMTGRAAPTARMLLGQAIVGAECLSSPHGHRIDPLARAPLAEGA